MSPFEVLESMLSLSNEVGNSNRWGGGAIKHIGDSAGICFEDNIPDADIPSKRELGPWPLLQPLGVPRVARDA